MEDEPIKSECYSFWSIGYLFFEIIANKFLGLKGEPTDTIIVLQKEQVGNIVNLVHHSDK